MLYLIIYDKSSLTCGPPSYRSSFPSIMAFPPAESLLRAVSMWGHSLFSLFVPRCQVLSESDFPGCEIIRVLGTFPNHLSGCSRSKTCDDWSYFISSSSSHPVADVYVEMKKMPADVHHLLLHVFSLRLWKSVES